MTFASYMGGKFSLAPRRTSRLLARKSCLQITTRFRFPRLPSIIFFSFKYNEHADKGKKKHVVHRWRKGFCFVMQGESKSRPVRNIPKFKDRGNWSRDSFQPMRIRACVYQNIDPVIKNFHNSGRSRTDFKISFEYSSRFHIISKKTFHVKE